jgi:CubicO group peptidase (beta-lactamase class C family)
MSTRALRLLTLVLFFCCSFTAGSFGADTAGQAKVKDAVDAVIVPLMREETIPGMAIAVTIDGRNYFLNYGVASRESRQPVTNETLFEIGSVSKTFTATLASYAEIEGDLSLSDSASKYLPSLRGSSFDHVSLINLGKRIPQGACRCKCRTRSRTPINLWTTSGTGNLVMRPAQTGFTRM